MWGVMQFPFMIVFGYLELGISDYSMLIYEKVSYATYAIGDLLNFY